MKTPPPPPPRSGPPPAAAATESRIQTAVPTKRTARVLLNCDAGWGKTTLMATSRNPIIILAPEESGYITHAQRGTLPSVPFVQAKDWADMVSVLVSEDLSGFDTICIDAISSFVASLRTTVLNEQFEGDAGKYAAWKKGEAATGSIALAIVPVLEKLAKHSDVIVGCHPGKGKFTNQDGDEYNSHIGDAPDELWNALKRWSDATLYGTHFVAVSDKRGKGDPVRVAYTKKTGSIDAKNNYDMPPMLKVGDNANELYSKIFSYIHKEG